MVVEYKKITIIDENGFVDYIQYSEAIKRNVIRKAAIAFIFDFEGNILVQKRSAHISKPLQLDKSVGGYIDEGETSLQTIVREMEEELGIKDVTFIEIESDYRTECFSDTVYKTVISRDTPIQIDPHEVDSIYWMTIEELEDKMQNEPVLFTVHFISSWFDLRDTLLT